MRREFKMSDEDLELIREASRPVPLIMLQAGMPLTPQQNANNAWSALGRKMGFKTYTAGPVEGKSEHYFMAEPTDDDT